LCHAHLGRVEAGTPLPLDDSEQQPPNDPRSTLAEIGDSRNGAGRRSDLVIRGDQVFKTNSRRDRRLPVVRCDRFCLLAAILFAAMALVQLSRPLMEWSATLNGHAMPTWPKLACLLCSRRAERSSIVPLMARCDRRAAFCKSSRIGVGSGCESARNRETYRLI
jgi:hypothetical protein